MVNKTLILLHGALGSEEQFGRLKKALDLHFEVYTFTFEGHGGVSKTGTFGMLTFVENVLTFMTSESIEKASFFGFSMGGYVALKFATIYPNKVEGIVTYGTKFAWTPEFSAGEIRKLNPEKIEEKVPKFAKHLDWIHSPLDWKDVVKDTADLMISLADNNELQTDQLRQITNPTLILLGELDQMSTVEESRQVAAHLPNGRFELIPKFEHAIERVDHEIIVKRIREFLNE